jgi:hypothetical protein
MALEATEILISDLDDVRTVLAACAGLLLARDMESAQVQFANLRSSPLRSEVERVKGRLDAYMGDFLIAQRDADIAADVEDQPEDAADVEDEEFSAEPLGKFKNPKQKGRRLSAEEV